MIIDLSNIPHGSTHIGDGGIFLRLQGDKWSKFVSVGVWESCPPPEWWDSTQLPAPRPDHIKCIADNDVENEGKSWCGRWIKHEYNFENIDHAAFNGRYEGRLVACSECTALIAKALANGQEDV